MAEEEQLELKPHGGKTKLLIIGVVLLLLIGGGVGGWLMWSGGDDKAQAKGLTLHTKSPAGSQIRAADIRRFPNLCGRSLSRTCRPPGNS